MKQTLIIISIFLCLITQAQKKTFQVEFSFGKFNNNNDLVMRFLPGNSNMFYFLDNDRYKGKGDITLGLSYYLTDRFQIHSAYNYGWMYNEKTNNMGHVSDFYIMPTYSIINKEKIQFDFAIGGGFEYVFLKSLNEIMAFNESLKGFILCSEIKLRYNINNKIQPFVKYYVSNGSMIYATNYTNETTYFSNINIGLRYKIWDLNKNE